MTLTDSEPQPPKDELSILRQALNKAAFWLKSYSPLHKHKDIETIIQELKESP